MRRLLASFRLLRPLAHCADRPMDPACRRLVLALCSETVVAIRGTLRSTLLADEGRDGAGRLSAKDRAQLAQLRDVLAELRGVVAVAAVAASASSSARGLKRPRECVNGD